MIIVTKETISRGISVLCPYNVFSSLNGKIKLERRSYSPQKSWIIVEWGTRSQTECNDANSATVQYLARALYWQEKNTNRGFRETWGWQTNKRDEISNPPSERQIIPLSRIYTIFYYIFYTFYISYNISKVYNISNSAYFMLSKWFVAFSSQQIRWKNQPKETKFGDK